MEPRKRRYAEDRDPFREGMPIHGGFPDRIKKSFCQGRSVLVFVPLDKVSPKHGLPVPFLMPLPSEDHFGTKEEVLVKGVCDTIRKLVELEALPGIPKIGFEVFKARFRNQGG